MGKEVSPKRLQKSREFDGALKLFKERYADAVEEDDQFLSGLYMDEIVYTVLLKEGKKIQEETLRQLLADVVKEFGPSKKFDALQDIDIAVRKRFPERFEIEDTKYEIEETK